jgi:hypothetical protein
MGMDTSLNLSFSRIGREHREQFNRLSTKCFAENKQFWSHASTYFWSEKDDQAFILGCFHGHNLIAYMKLEVFRSVQEFESRLIGMVHGKNTPTLQFPLFYFSKSATDPQFQRKGINAQLRRMAMNLAKEQGFHHAVSSMIENSEIMQAMKALGAECFENPIRWNNRFYRSDKKPFFASLSLANYTPEEEWHRGNLTLKEEFSNWLNRGVVHVPRLGYEYTKKNHFIFGFNQEVFGLEQKSTDTFFARYGNCERVTYDFRSECIIAANEIYQRRQGRPIFVCFSGGLDSEIVCESFRFARIPFRVIISRYNNDLNLHDYAWAVAYCEKHQIPYEFFDLDFLGFADSAEYYQLIRKVQCRYPMLTATMKLMEYVNHQKQGLPILGSAECWVNRIELAWYLVEPEPIQALYRYLIFTGMQGIPGFFQWSPELMNAYIMDPLVQSMIRAKIKGASGSADIKYDIYASYFKVEKRPKYRGFEKFDELMTRKLAEAQMIFKTPVKNANTEIKTLIERWNPELAKKVEAAS